MVLIAIGNAAVNFNNIDEKYQRYGENLLTYHELP